MILGASQYARPIRLRKSTREWAYRSLYGVYGDDAMKNGSAVLDEIDGFESLSNIEKYDVAIRAIAEQAPIRLCVEERVCGAATFGDAVYHVVPAKYKGAHLFSSVSHLTIGYEKVLREGITSYEKEIRERLEDRTLTASQRAFLKSLQGVIDSLRIWHKRYLDATETERPDLHALLQQVPFFPARSYHEALQSLWFVFSFVRLCGNWPGIGRLDLLLGDYLKHDLEAGVLDKNEARELLASFFIKGCEWVRSETPTGSGDAQHYQNIVLAGIDTDGREITNEVTCLILDVVEELAVSDFPITVRLNANTSFALKEKIARVMRHGGGIVALYNEELILQALHNLGYPEEEARGFANDGCWEVQIPGKTDFHYMPFDALQILNRVLGLNGEKTPHYASVEELYAAFRLAMTETVGDLYRQCVEQAYLCRDGEWQASWEVMPSSVVSLFEEGCIEHARSYYDFGPTYVVRSPHIGGAPDVANSLYAIQKLVFEEKKLSLSALVEILKRNWEGEEILRLYVKNHYVYYGNDATEADTWHARLLNDFADMVDRFREDGGHPVKFIPGVSTFGRQIEWLPYRCATAFGAKEGEILSGNDSPTPGTDLGGVTAMIKSYCKSDLVKQSCGAALDVKISPESLDGENGITALISLMDGFLALGGFFLQVDTVDVETLRAAQKDPQRYKTLSVRVSGWNARFVTLNEEWQRMIIERSSHRLT